MLFNNNGAAQNSHGHAEENLQCGHAICKGSASPALGCLSGPCR